MEHSLLKSVATLFLYHPRYKAILHNFHFPLLNQSKKFSRIFRLEQRAIKSKLHGGIYISLRYDKMCFLVSNSETCYGIVCSNEDGEKEDVYQFGVILLQIITGKVVAAGSSEMGSLKLQVCSCFIFSIKNFFSYLLIY